MTILGNVEKYATITPKVVRLYGPIGKQIKRSATIIPEEKYPFKIVSVRPKSGKNINYKLEEIKGPKVVKYILTIENIKKEKGKYHDVIHLKTNNKIHPEIKIRVYGNIFGEKQEGKQ